MSATVALVGRPNVGKSTLFNKLTKSRDALVANVPGLTRDRRYGQADFLGHTINLIDTGGLFGDHALAQELQQQTQLAVEEADLVVFMLDGRQGITASDDDILTYLRRNNVTYITAVNKMDGVNADVAVAEISRLGLNQPQYISASHSRGIRSLQEQVIETLLTTGSIDTQLTEQTSDLSTKQNPGIHVAIVGRPNVGKSTLVNRLIGEERQVVFDMPGTTKDAIDVPFHYEGIDYVLIDTAGVRRKGKVDEVTEKFSVVKSLQAMQRAAVVVLVLDASEGVVEQDLHVLQYALDAGCAMVVALNKWDGLDAHHKDKVKVDVERRLNFVPWIPIIRMSALHGTGVGHLFEQVERVYEAGEFDVSTSMLTRLLESLTANHPAPSVRGRQIKLKLATYGGNHPPTIMIHGNQLDSLPASYKRYLENSFREALDLLGNPVRLDYKRSDNPYAGRRNELTERQKRRRTRVIRHKKKSDKRRK